MMIPSPEPCTKAGRWRNNIALVVVNTIVMRVVFPTAAVGVAAYAIEEQWGLLNQLDMPMWTALVLSAR